MAMSAAKVRPVPGRLGVLADEARVFLATARRALYAYKEVGLRLAEAKSLLRHGEWLKWLKREFSQVTPAQAQKYLRLARYWPTIAPALVFNPDLTLSEAVLLPSRQVRAGRVAEACRRVDRAGRKVKPDSQGVVAGDFRTEGAGVPDESVALVFSDPPYNEESVSLYSDLAQFAARTLVEGGLVFVYAGKRSLPQVLDALRVHLDYVSILALAHGLKSAGVLHWCGLRSSWKVLLMLAKKGGVKPWWPTLPDLLLRPGPAEKTLHEHQQSLAEAVAIIGHFSRPDSLICDPFVGCGTTAVACKQLGRRFCGFEVNKEMARRAAGRIRLAESEAGA
jgi:site-specific DNA-methyltransferase (adenine-specific)